MYVMDIYIFLPHHMYMQTQGFTVDTTPTTLVRYFSPSHVIIQSERECNTTNWLLPVGFKASVTKAAGRAKSHVQIKGQSISSSWQYL